MIYYTYHHIYFKKPKTWSVTFWSCSNENNFLVLGFQNPPCLLKLLQHRDDKYYWWFSQKAKEVFVMNSNWMSRGCQFRFTPDRYNLNIYMLYITNRSTIKYMSIPILYILHWNQATLMKQCNFTKGAHLHLCANQPWIIASELMTIRIFEK